MKRTRNKNAVARHLLVTALTLFAFITTQTGISDGIGGSGMVSGRVSQFHSIVVNGVHYETTNSVVQVNGEMAELSQIKVGQLVMALVDYETLEALEIDQFDTVTGPIQAVEVWDEGLAQMHLRVLEQDVIVDIETVFHLEDPLGLKTGNAVTIGGLRDEEGFIRASVIEQAQDKHDLLVSGLADHVAPDSFRIGDLRITSPYLAEYIEAGWLYEGASVLVHGETYEDEELVAATVMPIPVEMVVAGIDPGYAEIRIDGPIHEYDPETGAMSVNGIDLTVTEKAVFHDLRDFIRWFGMHDIYPSDVVSVVAKRGSTGLNVTKLVRLKKAKTFIRAPLESQDLQAESLRVLQASIDDWTQASEIRFAGEKVKDDELPDLVRARDGVEVEWKNDGKIKHFNAVPRCSTSNAWWRYSADGSLTKEEQKANAKARKRLKKEDRRAYACFMAE